MSPIEVSLIAPCLNEEENVQILSSRFLSASTVRGILAEVVFVDDGSTDSTWQRVNEIRSVEKDRVTIVRHSSNRGISQSWLSGLEVSRGRLACLIDSDLQNPPESVFDLYDLLLLSGAQLARGVRRPTSSQQRSRVVMSRVLNTVLNVIFGMKSRDNKSGFVLADRELLMKIVRHGGHYSHYQTFLGVAAHAHGVTTVETDTPFENRRHGISFLSGSALKVMLQVLGDIPEARREFGSRFSRRTSR